LVDGSVIKKFRKGWERNEDECLDKVMQDLVNNPRKKAGVEPVAIEEELSAE
jgi:hypothetical protein